MQATAVGFRQNREQNGFCRAIFLMILSPPLLEFSKQR